MSPHKEKRIINICKDHNWVISAAQLEIIKECAEDHHLSVTLDAFHDQPLQFHSPRKKAKELAIEFAVKLFNNDQHKPNKNEITGLAEEIYQWLTNIDPPITPNNT